MNLLYPEMDSPSGPSIMGSENPKFFERRNGQSDSDSTSEAHTPMDSSTLSHRRSKDGLSREERMKLVRGRQMEEHKRRLDELRQAQIQAMKAKHQQDEDRRRRLEEIKNRDEQRRAAVETRRKRMEDEERERCEAIVRKHQEIFDRIDSKKRQHESRKMAYGLSTYQLSDQDSVFVGGQPSRRAISASALSRRTAGSATARSSHNNQSSSRFSPGSVQSARLRPSPSTPSRNGGGHFDSISGSKTASLENSPSHSGRQPNRLAQSHPPPTSRNRVPETARSKPDSRPPSGQVDTPSARAKRPTSLMTRSVRVERQGKSAATTPETSFRTMSKRSQSVGNVSARNRAKLSPDAMKPALSQRDVTETSPRKTEEVRFEETPTGQSPEPTMNRAGRKVISEAEAKAALAEKRRLARLKVEFERTQPTDTLEEAVPTTTPSTLGVESPPREPSRRRASEIEFLELEKSFTEESRSMEPSVFSAFKKSAFVGSTDEQAVVPDSFSPLPEEETVGSGVLTSGFRESPLVDSVNAETVVRKADDMEREKEVQEVTVDRAEDLPSVTVISEEPQVPEEKEIPSEPTTETQVRDTVQDDTKPAAPVLSPVDVARVEAERRRLELEQQEEEERIARRARLEAIKRLTKGGDSSSNLTGSTERLSSPAVETAKPVDALENARKLLQRRGLAETSSLVSSPSTGSFKGLFPVEVEVNNKSKGDLERDVESSLAPEMRAVSSPFSDVSSTDTVSLNGYVRSQDGGDGLQNGYSIKTLVRNGSTSGMSESSSVDFEPYTPKEDWLHVIDNGDARPDIWSGSSPTAPHTGLISGNGDLLLNFDGH